jgi:hypothetical protein
MMEHLFLGEFAVDLDHDLTLSTRTRFLATMGNHSRKLGFSRALADSFDLSLVV